MIGEKTFDCQEMFRHACAFAEVADLATEKFKHDTADIDFYVIPSAVNSAFACEVFLKAILKHSDIGITKQHDLKELFELLPERIKTFVKETSSANYGGSWTNWIGYEYLENVSKAFVEWRYIYEVDFTKIGSVGIDPGFLVALRNALREACCQLFFGMNWEEYKTNNIF